MTTIDATKKPLLETSVHTVEAISRKTSASRLIYSQPSEPHRLELIVSALNTDVKRH